MAMLPDVFIPEEADDAGFKTLDAGWYEAEIIKSDLKNTKNKDGKYIELRFKIIGEEDSSEDGRLVFANLNIVNKNKTAVRIAQSDLKKICEAVSFEGELEDTEDLHNQSMLIKLIVKPETDQWPEKNEVKDFKAV